MSATLFWKLSDQERTQDWLEKNLGNLLKNRPELKPLFFNGMDDPVAHFFQLFFPVLETSCYVANLSLEDKSAQKINLSIRIPAHPVFSECLPEHCSLAVIGYWNTTSNTPWFTPEKIMITHNDDDATKYEHEITCIYQQLGVGGVNFPPNGIQNVLSRQLANNLPKFAVGASKRLEDWSSFLRFKRNLIRQKTVGLRYINCKYNPETYQVELLVVATSKEYLERVRMAFSRQTLELFDLNISSNNWIFTLPEEDKENKKTVKSELELGQIARGKKSLVEVTAQNLHSKEIQTLKTIHFDNPTFALLNVDLNEDWKNKLEKIDDGSDDEEVLLSNQEIISNFTQRIPEQGFISFSLVGDLALISRQERVVKNLRQNENCYSPYLSSYLFDITQAQTPKTLLDIQDWFNADLNDAQKSAVKKMLAAPDLCLIQGPPGTGKTTVIAEAILQFAKNGQTVLLASQAHDAIDNALSRIKNRPELRAIRLAKESRGRTKITDEGQMFAGAQALARHYDALAQHINGKFLKPLKDKQEVITNLKDWLKLAEFLSEDMQKSQQKLQKISQQGKEKNQTLKQAQQDFNTQLQQYEQQQKRKQQIEQLCEFLQHQSSAPTDLTLPYYLFSVVKTLFLLKDTQIKVPFTLLDFQMNPQSQMLILIALFDLWKKVQAGIEQIQLDVHRLASFGSGGLTNIGTKLKIKSLEDEVEVLDKQLEEEFTEDVKFLWKAKRQELRDLRQSSDGLTHPCYQLFEDAEQFSNVQNAQNTAQILSQRLALFAQINQDLAIQINSAIQQLKNETEQLQLKQPEDNLVKQLAHEIQSLRDAYAQQQDRQKKIQQNQSEHLKKQNFNQEFQICVTAVTEHIKNLESEYVVASAKHKEWQSLFEQWHQVLQQSGQEIQDWELLKDTYTKNCNLVAISCNENERTLTEAGLDGFDVVIIDEVSKATPLELLLPLMRARKAILVGDHRQLPPLFQEGDDSATFEDVVDEKEEDTQSRDTLLTKENFEKYKKMVTASLFKELFEKAPDILRERLTVQFRMHPDIMKMINYFYEGQLECGNPDIDRNHYITLKTKYNDLVTEKKHLLWVDTSNDEKGVACLDDGSTNPTEAKLIAQALVCMNEQMKKQGFNSKKKYKVGVVSFYQAQCRVIRDAIRKVNHGQIRFDAIDVEINTVIRYQGKEKPIILISLVRNDGKSKNHRRSSSANVARFEFINVAMSRAQNLLMVFGARNMLEMRDIILPKMDSQGNEKKKVYQDIFNRLDREAQICSAKEFVQACDS